MTRLLYLLDTDTCADVLRGRLDVIKRLRGVSPEDVGISTITSYELHTGVAKCRNPERERKKLGLFLGVTRILPFLEPTAREAARVRAELEARGCPIGPYDTLLAGHALSANLTLVTSNQTEFSRVRALRIESWRSQ